MGIGFTSSPLQVELFPNITGTLSSCRLYSASTAQEKSFFFYPPTHSQFMQIVQCKYSSGKKFFLLPTHPLSVHADCTVQVQLRKKVFSFTHPPTLSSCRLYSVSTAQEKSFFFYPPTHSQFMQIVQCKYSSGKKFFLLPTHPPKKFSF